MKTEKLICHQSPLGTAQQLTCLPAAALRTGWGWKQQSPDFQPSTSSARLSWAKGHWEIPGLQGQDAPGAPLGGSIVPGT